MINIFKQWIHRYFSDQEAVGVIDHSCDAVRYYS